MIQRRTTKQEEIAWEEYNRVLRTIPNYNLFDRVSLMKAFPALQEAFDNAASVSLKITDRMNQYDCPDGLWMKKDEFPDFVCTVVSCQDELKEVENWLLENNIDHSRVMHTSGREGIECHWYMPEEQERVMFFLKWGQKTFDW